MTLCSWRTGLPSTAQTEALSATSTAAPQCAISSNVGVVFLSFISAAPIGGSLRVVSTMSLIFLREEFCNFPLEVRR